MLFSSKFIIIIRSRALTFGYRSIVFEKIDKTHKFIYHKYERARAARLAHERPKEENMSNYWITTEATADFPESLMKEDFAIIPMSYTVKGEFFDGADKKLTPKQFYDACREA